MHLNHRLHFFIGEEGSKPLVISTWNHGMEANEVAWEILSNNGRALDAVEQGVRLTEADEENLSVGIGGLPDRDGIVTLDASIMDETGNAGSVCFLLKHQTSDFRSTFGVWKKLLMLCFPEKVLYNLPL